MLATGAVFCAYRIVHIIVLLNGTSKPNMQALLGIPFFTDKIEAER